MLKILRSLSINCSVNGAHEYHQNMIHVVCGITLYGIHEFHMIIERTQNLNNN